jgi:hypothetical protein
LLPYQNPANGRFKKLFFGQFCAVFAHVLSSILIGLIGILIGWSLLKLNVIESTRGTWASWMLLIFGVFYTLWGLYDLKRNKLHKHFEVDDQAEIYVYEHRNGESVLPNQKFKVTLWVMFFIFALGPSEPLIPLLFYPTVEQSFYQVVVLVIIYTAITILMMLLMVTLGYYGVQRFSFPSLEKFMGLLSGLVILICGVGMVFLNW